MCTDYYYNNKPTFEFNRKKIVIVIFFYFFLIFITIRLIFYEWSWFLLIRALTICFIIIILTYKILQAYLIKKEVFINNKLLENIYNKLFAIYDLINWYNWACNKMDELYIPNKYLEKKNIIYNNTFLKYIMILFFLGYVINNVFLVRIDLHIIWNLGFMLTGIYIFFIIYLDNIYIYPNLVKFSKSNIVFDGDGPYGNWSPSIRRTMYYTGRYGGGAARFCYFCLLGLAGGNWIVSEIHPERRAPLAIVGDKLEYIPSYKEKLDKYMPLKDKPPTIKE